MNLIDKLEQEEIERVSKGKTYPDFQAGDTVSVLVNVIEGNHKRTQAFEGVVIARRNRGLNSSFIVRKISSGEGVERTFQLYSLDRSEAPRCRAPRQALLPARPFRQGRSHPRTSRPQGREGCRIIRFGFGQSSLRWKEISAGDFFVCKD